MDIETKQLQNNRKWAEDGKIRCLRPNPGVR